MIKVRIQANSIREEVIVDPNTTLRKVLDDTGVQYSTAVVNIDGCPLRPGDMDKTFTAFGVTDTCFLTAIVKQDNN